ncbi:MAG: hypothetical protein J6S72_06125 [Lachnospiraceae bacterium]|nr:hypothetical protein [Lachnospiraceae bacterium]MBO7633945.1 hypothetical protein [Lachnospiraceae bacterium]
MSRNKKGLICIAAAAVLIAAGLLMKQNAAVLAKAIRVCLECIGVG